MFKGTVSPFNSVTIKGYPSEQCSRGSLLQQTYLSFSILSVDGNNAVHVGTLFAGLSDTDIDNFPKITIRLQVLVRKYNSVMKFH